MTPRTDSRHEEARLALCDEQLFALQSVLHSLSPTDATSFFYSFNEGLNTTIRERGLRLQERAEAAHPALLYDLRRALAAKDVARAQYLTNQLAELGPERLAEAMGDAAWSALADRIVPPYRFRLAGSFQTPGMISFFGISYSEPRQRFYLSDQRGGKIHVFDGAGVHAGILDAGFGRPRGLFTGPGDTVWVSDAGRSELVCFDRTDRKTRTIRLSDLFPGSPNPRPFHGCVHENAIVLIMDSEDDSRKDVARIPLDGEEPELLDATGLRLPTQVRSCGGRLLLSDQTNYFRAWDAERKRFFPAPDLRPMGPVPYFAERNGTFCHCSGQGNGLFLCSPGDGPRFAWHPGGDFPGRPVPAFLEFVRTNAGVRLCTTGADGTVLLFDVAAS